MWNIPLAHGQLGSWDEILPVAVVGIFTVILIVAGIISRRNEETDTNQSPKTDPAENSDTHYRLD